jgi:hypothetical protein
VNSTIPGLFHYFPVPFTTHTADFSFFSLRLGSEVTTYGHNSYTHDGIANMDAVDLSTLCTHELLLLAAETMIQLPAFLNFHLDCKAFKNAFYVIDEHRTEYQIDPMD